MKHATATPIPQRELRKLEFLVGESSGTQILYPPGSRPVRSELVCVTSREACDRFMQIAFFSETVDIGIESFNAFLTFSSKQGCYEMWVFSSTTEEPLHMTGDFRGNDLVMISDPWPMPWGLQRIRSTFSPGPDGGIEYVTELWEPDGYVRYRSTHLNRQQVGV